MAEGGAYTSIKDGSDADFEYTCTPCGEYHIREEAVKYCPECEEYLCTKCAKEHERRKATISHKLQDTNAAKQLPVVKTKCHYHPDRDIEMYCGAHDMVYCAKCIAKEHRSCSGVIDVDDIRPSAVQQKQIRRLQEEARKIDKRLTDAEKNTEKNIGSLKEQRDEITRRLEEIEENLIEHVRKLKREAVGKLNREYAAVNDELKSTVSMVDDMRNEIDKSNNQLQMLTNIDAGQQFVQIKLIQKTVNDAVNLVEDSEAKGSKAFCFTENADLKTSVMTATSIGSMNTVTEEKSQTTPKLFKVKSKREINVRLPNDKTNYVITDICQLQDGTIILADSKNKNIKSLDMDYKIKDCCDLDARPTGICCTGQNEVAVKMDNNKVQLISVGSSLTKLRNISIEGGVYYGMTYCAGEVWVSTGSGVNVYNTSGTLLMTFNKDDNGKRIFKSTTHNMAVSGDTVIVTDFSDGAVCLRRDGRVKRELRDGRLASTTGACVSSDGTVFLSGYSSNNIVMFDRDGKYLGELVPKDAGLVTPISLCYDDKNNCIIVTCSSSDNIVILDVSD